MSTENTSTIRNASDSSRTCSVATSSITWPDNTNTRKVRLWTDVHESGTYEWTINENTNTITAEQSGSEFDHWWVSAVVDASNLYMFGKKEERSCSKKYMFVCSNLNQDGLELSQPQPIPTDSNPKDDTKVFHLKQNSLNGKTIFCHCATNKFVTLVTGTESRELRLQTEEEHATHWRLEY